MTRRAVYLLSSVVTLFLFAAIAAPLDAETIDKLTYLTFSRTVQVPGVKLDPGTYRFRLANPDTSRNVIQVLSHDGSTVFAMFHTLPDSRTTVTRESTVTFRETPAGVPPAVKSLFYGGEHGGYEFEYPKRGLVTAELTAQPEITYAPNTVVAATESSAEAEVRAEPAKAEPTPEPVPTPEPAESAVAAPGAEAQASQPELPRTASPVPLVALGGFASILAGLGAGLFRRFVS
jgi:hypothetical protein